MEGLQDDLWWIYSFRPRIKWLYPHRLMWDEIWISSSTQIQLRKEVHGVYLCVWEGEIIAESPQIWHHAYQTNVGLVSKAMSKSMVQEKQQQGKKCTRDENRIWKMKCLMQRHCRIKFNYTEDSVQYTAWPLLTHLNAAHLLCSCQLISGLSPEESFPLFLGKYLPVDGSRLVWSGPSDPGHLRDAKSGWVWRNE